MTRKEGGKGREEGLWERRKGSDRVTDTETCRGVEETRIKRGRGGSLWVPGLSGM